MHFALRTVLGDKVAQKGSLVTPESTRFDFSYGKPVTAEQIAEVERIVNAQILKNTPVQTRVLPIEEAKKTGAVMLFGERYGEVVRVLDIGKSTEFLRRARMSRPLATSGSSKSCLSRASLPACAASRPSPA